MLEEAKISLRNSKIFFRKMISEQNMKNMILLHGMSFTSNNWVQLNAFQTFANAGFNVYAPDYPGFGNSEGNPEYQLDSNFSNGSKFILDFTEELKLSKSNIIGPSMGGGIVLRTLIDYDIISSGIVIAPAGIQQMIKDLHKIKVPLLILWGEKDQVINKENAKLLLGAVPESTLVMVPDGGHALYLEKPNIFYSEVMKFIN
jgi:pimeloyl-ACP methyl ester carboxylesterase